jgi:hypothetical protein
MSIQAGLGESLPLSRLHGAAVVCLVGIGKPEVRREGGTAAAPPRCCRLPLAAAGVELGLLALW